jgi:hypothetical protein
VVDYYRRDDTVIVRRELHSGWSAFTFIPVPEVLVLRRKLPNGETSFLYYSNNHLYRCAKQIDYPKKQ